MKPRYYVYPTSKKRIMYFTSCIVHSSSKRVSNKHVPSPSKRIEAKQTTKRTYAATYVLYNWQSSTTTTAQQTTWRVGGECKSSTNSQARINKQAHIWYYYLIIYLQINTNQTKTPSLKLLTNSLFPWRWLCVLVDSRKDHKNADTATDDGWSIQNSVQEPSF